MFLYVGIAVGVGEKLKHEKLGKITYMICLDNLASRQQIEKRTVERINKTSHMPGRAASCR